MKTIIGIVIVLIVLIASVFGYNYILSQGKLESSTSSISMGKQSQKTYKHTFPEQITKSDFFQGSFIHNDVASIYPRREALVKDILVDIGDSVTEGQTIAILFEPGVSGQAGSNIGLKSTILNSSSKILADTMNISDAKISEFESKVIEKETLLLETLNNYEVKISQIQNIYETKAESLANTLEVENKILVSLEVKLENAHITKKEKLEEARNNISQKEILLNYKIDEVYTQIIPIVYLGKEEEINYYNISNLDLSQLFSARDSQVRNELVFEIKKFQNERYTIDSLVKYNLILNINRLLVLGLENTLYSSGDTDESKVSNYITQAKIYNISLLNQKEIYDDTIISLKVLEVSETEKLSQLEQDIEKQKAKIYRVQSDSTLFTTDNSVQLTKSEKKLQIEKLSSELDTLKKSKDLLIANENKQITSASNSVAKAQADLNKEYVASGDYKIISPFSGNISKRDLEIGAMISPKGEAFRVVGVDNSLSRITKKEIKFYVPEILKDSLIMNKEVIFTLGGNKNKSFTGVIHRISPEINQDNFSITVQAKVDENINIPNKSTIRVNIETKKDIFQIPTTSIYNKDERTIVYYKKENGKLGIRDVSIISDDGEYSFVSGKIDETLKVVTTPIFIK